MKKLLLATLLVIGCALAPYQLNPTVPTVVRPNTVHIKNHQTDSLAIEETIAIFQKADPNEGFVCYYGVATDSSIHVRRAVEGRTVRAYPDSIITDPRPCDLLFEGNVLVGAAHSHPRYFRCELSNSDRVYLFVHREFLFFAALCPSGFGSVQYQDGRVSYFNF